MLFHIAVLTSPLPPRAVERTTTRLQQEYSTAETSIAASAADPDSRCFEDPRVSQLDANKVVNRAPQFALENHMADSSFVRHALVCERVA